MTQDHHTINSGIVKDAFLAIADSEIKDFYVGGGMALQFDIPEEYHRPTTDIDLTSKNFITYPEFKTCVESAFSHLIEAGYELSSKKGRNTFDAYLDRDNVKLMVQIPRRSRGNFRKKKPILDREFAHIRKKDLPRGSINVISLEDLVAHKIVRSKAFIEDYNLRAPNQEDLQSLIDNIVDLRDDLEITLMGLEPGEVAKKVARIRLYADIFDMKAITTLLEEKFDENYFREAIATYNQNRGTLSEKLDFFYSLV